MYTTDLIGIAQLHNLYPTLNVILISRTKHLLLKNSATRPTHIRILPTYFLSYLFFNEAY